MQIFETQIIVSKKDIDELEHVNNVRYVQWINNVAKLHWLKNTNNKITNNFYWVVLSHNIEYKKSAQLNDVILVKTYVTESEGVTSLRIVKMYNRETGKLLVRSETNWCLIDAKTNRPTRITKEIANLFN